MAVSTTNKKVAIHLKRLLYNLKAHQLIILLGLLCASRTIEAQEISVKYALSTEGDLHSGAFTPDGSFVATVSGVRTEIDLWNITNGTRESKLSPDKSSNSIQDSGSSLHLSKPGYPTLRMSPDSRVLAVLSGATKDVRLWDIRSKSLFRVLSSVQEMRSCEFSPDGRVMALAMGSHGLKLLDVYKGRLITDHWNFKHVSSVTAADFNKSGSNLVVGIASADDRLSGFYLVDIASGDIKSSILAPDSQELTGTINQERTLIATFDNKHTDIKLWDLNTGLLKTAIKAGSSKILEVAMSYDGLRLAVLTKDGRVRVWNTTTSALVAELSRQVDKVDEFKYLTFGPNPEICFLEGDKGLRVWLIAKNVLGPQLPGAQTIYDISPTGEFFLTDQKGGGALLWQIRK